MSRAVPLTESLTKVIIVKVPCFLERDEREVSVHQARVLLPLAVVA